jgi:magnesium transporter
MEVLTEVDRDRIEALRTRDEFFWLDLESPSDADLDLLGELLGLHELAMEDTREFGQRPKLDRYPDRAVLLVYWTAHVAQDGVGVEMVEVHLHISGGFLFTVRRAPGPELDALHDTLVPEGTQAEEYIIYVVLDTLTDALYPVIDHMEERIDALEDAVLHDTDRHQLTKIYRLKQEVLTLERRVASQRDQFGPASEAILELPGLTHGSRPYLRDIGDHLAQVTQELYRQADDLGALTSTYFNANANRLNRLATRLTVLATFFLIWTLVTSFFGQNFGWLVRHVDSLEAFLIYDGIGLVIPTIFAAVYFWRRRREWL